MQTFNPLNRLEVYRVALEGIVEASRVAKALPRGCSDIADQMVRAACSTHRNVAEGAGRVSSGDKRHHYAIALGSALEVVACLDEVDALDLGPSTVAARSLALRAAAMLYRPSGRCSR